MGHTKEVLCIAEATNILEADIILKEKTGYEAVKNPWIHCEIEF